MIGKSLRSPTAGLVLCFALLGCSRESGNRPVTILVPVEANTLDPQFATSTIERSILMNVFEGLVIRNKEMLLEPGLALRWEVDDSKKIWTFHLRRGVRFHNGEKFDARSVAYTFRRMRDEKVRARSTIPRRIRLERVEVVDDYTVRLHTRTPVAILPYWLPNAFLLPPGYYSKTPLKKLLRKPVGTGPYRIEVWKKDDFLRMEAFEGWWRGKPKIRSVVWRPVPEPSARVAELETRAADIATNISPEMMDILRSSRNNVLSVAAIQGGRRIYIGIRTDHGFFADRRVRQAMNYAVNFRPIAEKILRSHGTRMRSVVNPPNDDPGLKAYPYDPARAKALLAEAGLRDTDGDGILEWKGEPAEVVIDVPVARYLKGVEISEAIADNLREVGIGATVRPLEWSVFLSSRRKKKLSPLYFHGFSSAFNEEIDLGVLRPSLYANLTAWRNPEFIEKFNRLADTFDRRKRREISYRLQRLIHEEAPWIFVWQQYDFYGVSQRIRWVPRQDERIYIPSIELRDSN